MLRSGFCSLFAASVLSLVAPVFGAADKETEATQFNEVYNLVKAHAAGVSPAELDRAAVQALVTALSPKVMLVTNGTASASEAKGALLQKASLFDGPIGYLRIEQVNDGLAKTVREAYDKLATTNKLKGLAIDLRYAQGTDYAAAVAVVDLFVQRERPLLNWGEGMVSSKDNNDAVLLPVAVLVNQQTSGAAEALAAMLRETGRGLILGNRTAGKAMMAQEFPLRSGERLRIATAPMPMGDGSELTTDGVKPDISVQVNPTEEHAYYADAFKVLPKSASGGTSANPAATNRVSRRTHLTEADLVRARRDGLTPDGDIPLAAGENEPEKPVVRDPTLARALDLLKGLAVVREARS